MSSADDVVGGGSHRILANTAWRASADVGSKLISLVFFVVLARELGDSDFGLFVFGLAVATILTALASFGQDPVLTREVAGERTRVHAYFANTIALKLALALPALAAAAVVMALVGTDPDTRAVLLLLGLALLAEQLTATCFAVYQAYERLSYVPVVILTQRALTTAAAVAALLHGAGVVAVSAIYLAVAIGAFLLALALLVGGVVHPRAELDVTAWKRLLRAAFPVGIALVFSMTLFRVDTAILALLEPDAVVGDYGAAFRLFEATLFLSWGVWAAVYPVFAQLGGNRDGLLSDLFDRGLKLAVLPTLPLAVGALVLGPPVLTLVFGTEFEEGGTALLLLAPAIALYPVEHLAAGLLIAQRRQNAVAVVLGVVAALNIVANVLLIPVYSLNAAALNTSLSELLLAVCFLALARPLAGSVDWRRVAAGPALGAALAGSTMLVLRDWLPLAIVGGAVVYVAAVVAWERRAFPEDARAVSDFLLRRS